MTLELNKVYCADCLDLMREIEDKSVDMILADLPYGTTACKWDTIIPFEPLWEQYKRIIKDNGAIVLTASQPFTSALVMSNVKMFKYEWVWEKNNATGFFNCNNLPMKKHENILVFYSESPTYNPQGIRECGLKTRRGSQGENYNPAAKNVYVQEYENYPTQLLKFNYTVDNIHPTQKPVALFSYLIRTYTNEGDVVLDNCAGSCTTAISCIDTKRNYICIEQEEKYCTIARKRISQHQQQQDLFRISTSPTPQ